MKYSNYTIGNRTRLFSRNFFTKMLSYLLFFAPERKPFELKDLSYLCLCTAHSCSILYILHLQVCVLFSRNVRNVSRPYMFCGPNTIGNVILFLLLLHHPTVLVFVRKIR